MPLLRLISRLPLGILYLKAYCLGFLVFTLGGYRRAEAAANLEGAFPDLEPAARQRLQRAYERHLCEVAAEILKGLSVRREVLLERVSVTGLDAVEADVAAGRAVLLATAHTANWEWLLQSVSVRLSVPLTALYKPIRGALAERFFKALRGRFGAHLVPAKDVVAELARVGGEARVYAMVADQVPTSTPHRYWGRFLGRDTAFYMGIDDLARARGLSVYTLFAERTSRGHYRARVVRLAEPPYASLPPREIVRRYVAALESQLLAQPADWLWGHRRWKLKKPLYGR